MSETKEIIKGVENLEKIVERRKYPRFDGYKPKKYYFITMLSPLLLLAGGSPFHHFVVEVVLANPILNGLIIFVMLLGIFVIMKRVQAVQKQFATLHVLTEAYKAEIPISEVMKNPRVFYSSVGHVVTHIAKTEGKISSGMIKTAINDELDHVQHGFQAGYEVPNYIVGFMIAMGLTGTFIGLLETMLGISAMLGGINSGGGGDMTQAVMGLIGELQKPLAGMGTAFSASLFGLIGSAMLGLMMVALKYAVAEFMTNLRRYISTVVEHDVVEAPAGRTSAKDMVAARAGVSEAFLSEYIVEVMDQQTQTQEVFRQSQENTIKLSVRIDKLADNIASVGELLKAHVETSKRMYDLLGYGPRMRELSEQTLEEIRRFGEAQKQQGNLTGETTLAITGLDQRFVKISNQLSQLSTEFQSQGEIGQGAVQGMARTLGNLHEGLSIVVKDSAQGRQIAIDIARHLAEVINKLQDLRGGNEMLAKIQDSTAGQAVVLDLMLSELRTARTSIVRDLRGELREISRLAANAERPTDG